MNDRFEELAEQSRTQPFAGFVCWKPEQVGAILNTEAAAPSARVLAATHHPVPLEQLDVSTAGVLRPRRTASEDEVVDVVAETHREAMIVPIIGPSGSGKSHFVLWLKAQLELREGASRRVVHIPKWQLSLPGVIDQLLQGESGPEFDDLRKKVHEVSASSDERAAAERFRNELCVALGELSPGDDDPDRAYVLDKLPSLLYDDAYARHLFEEKAALRRAVRTTRGGDTGSGDGETDEARFVPGDLPITLHGDEDKLGESANDFLAALRDARTETVTYELLNDVRDIAMRRVFGVEPNQLVRAMRELRRRFYERDNKMEIVLLIEDFTSLPGVQYELLEAMLELPLREGKQEICNLTAVIAVTSDRFNEILAHSDTLRTRLQSQGHVYSIDPHVGEDESALSTDDVEEFVARYLNAARVGQETIDARDGELPSICGECAHQSHCFAAFGATDRMGLYPFNHEVLAHLARAREMKLNPRDWVTTLRDTLSGEARALSAGEFPRTEWAETLMPADPEDRAEIALPSEVAVAAENTAHGERRKWLQTLWSETRDGVTDLDDVIHEAFQLSKVGQKIAPVPPQPGEDPKPPGQRADPIDLWVNGAVLKADQARKIRRALHQAILDRAGGATLLLSADNLETVFRPESINIDGAQGGGQLGADAVVLHYERSAESAEFFRVALDDSRSGTRGLAATARYLAHLEAQAGELNAFLAQRRRIWLEQIGPLTRALALAGLVFGRAPDATPAGLLKGIFERDDLPTASASQWFDALVGERPAKARGFGRDHLMRFTTALRSLDARDPAVLDASPLLKYLDDALTKSAVPDKSELPQQAAALATAFARLEPALENALTYLKEWRDAVSELIGDGTRLEVLVKRLNTLGARVRRSGEDLRLTLPARYEDDTPALLDKISGLIDRWETASLGERITAVLALDRPRLDELLEATRETSRELEQATKAIAKRAKQDGAGRSGDLAAQLVAELDGIEHVIGELYANA